MRKAIPGFAYLFALTLTVLISCKKDDVPAPPPPPPTGDFAVKVKASITVGDVVYDSIPATATITTWDRSGVQHQRTEELQAGTNTVYVPKAHTKYRIRFTKWGATAERTILDSEVSEHTTYVIGASKAAKFLSQEVGYRYQDGAYQVVDKATYVYEQGRLKEIQRYYMDYDHPTPHFSLYSVDKFTYSGSRLERVESIDKMEPGDNVVGYNVFSYNAAGKVVGIQYGSPAEVSSAHLEYVQQGGQEMVRMNYFDGNVATGSRLDLTFSGGNRVEQKSIIPNYPTNTRSYTFDSNINPYVHLKWPAVDLSFLSKNNVLEEQLDLTVVSARSEYTYDADGYVTEVRKSQVGPNGALPVFKRVYTY